MKNTSSKIIIFLLLTLVLWGGVNLAFENNHVSLTVGIEKAYAVGSEEMSWWKKAGVSLSDLTLGIAGAGYSAPVIAALSGILALLYPILAIVAALLDASIQLSISGFKTFVESSSIIDSWIIIRDLFNISFIFILLYIAITTIIGGAGVKTKVLVKDVIIGALLINFSMFFTKIIIDGGNILATAMFNKISADTSSWTFGLTGQIMNSLKLQSLLNFNIFKASGQTNAIASLVFSIIIVCLAIWAFLYGAILFLLRNVMLLFLLAISPIGFIGGTIPWIKDKSSEWWSALLQQVAVAPFFLFMIFMLMKLIGGIKGELNLTAGTEDYMYLTSGKLAINYGMFINAFMIIGMLLVGTKMTKKLAGKMSGVAEKIVGLATTAIAMAATAGIGAVAAGGVTAGTSLTTRGVTMATKGGLGRVGGSILQLAGKTVTGASQIKKTFDGAINAPGVVGRTLTAGKKGLLSSIKKETGLDLDWAGQKKADAKEDEKRHGEIANDIGPKKINEEIENREATMENITTRAKDKLNNDTTGRQYSEDLEAHAKTINDLNEKITGLDKTIKDKTSSVAEKTTAENTKQVYQQQIDDAKQYNAEILQLQKDREKTLLDGVKEEIGKGMGYDVAGHKDKIKELKLKRIEAEEARDKYIATIKNPKISEKLRALKGGNYKDKSTADLLVEQMKKQLKDEAEKEAKKTT